MKNANLWFPTKYEYTNGKLSGSTNPTYLTPSSRLVTNLAASRYQKYIPIYATGKLIDLGCGNAPLYGFYKKFVSENICADWPNSVHKNQFLDIECDLNEALPFSGNEFDTIILSDVLEHIRKPEELFHEMNRILKPGGYIIMNVPFFYKIHEAPYDYYRYSKYALEMFADKANLKINHLEEMGGIPEIFVDLTAKMIIKLPFVGSTISILLQSFSTWFLSTRFGENLSNKTRKDYPSGYFLILKKELTKN